MHISRIVYDMITELDPQAHMFAEPVVNSAARVKAVCEAGAKEERIASGDEGHEPAAL